MKTETRKSEQAQSPQARTPQSRVYAAPRLVELGALEQVQGTGGEFRDYAFGGYYPRHD